MAEQIRMRHILAEKGKVKLVHPGRHVEVLREPITVAEVMSKNPRHLITRPDVFKFPWVVLKPETVLPPGQVFLLVPNRTVYDLMKSQNHRRQRGPVVPGTTSSSKTNNPTLVLSLPESNDVSFGSDNTSYHRSQQRPPVVSETTSSSKTNNPSLVLSPPESNYVSFGCDNTSSHRSQHPPPAVSITTSSSKTNNPSLVLSLPESNDVSFGSDNTSFHHRSQQPPPVVYKTTSSSKTNNSSLMLSPPESNYVSFGSYNTSSHRRQQPPPVVSKTTSSSKTNNPSLALSPPESNDVSFGSYNTSSHRSEQRPPVVSETTSSSKTNNPSLVLSLPESNDVSLGSNSQQNPPIVHRKMLTTKPKTTSSPPKSYAGMIPKHQLQSTTVTTPSLVVLSPESNDMSFGSDNTSWKDDDHDDEGDYLRLVAPWLNEKNSYREFQRQRMAENNSIGESSSSSGVLVNGGGGGGGGGRRSEVAELKSCMRKAESERRRLLVGLRVSFDLSNMMSRNGEDEEDRKRQRFGD